VKGLAIAFHPIRYGDGSYVPSLADQINDSGGELEQIQFLLGHVSVQTTERYIGCKQRLKVAANDRLGIEPK
jgi:hypothetical protein